jgi:hypothetical protein
MPALALSCLCHRDVDVRARAEFGHDVEGEMAESERGSDRREP